MDLDKVLESRRSIRQYSNKKIPWAVLSEVLNSSTFSPSSGNIQNYRFVIVTNEEKKKQLAAASLKQSWIQTAPAIIVICADYSAIKKLYENNYEELSLQNCAIAASNLMLKATSQGLSTCYVSVFDRNAVSRVLRIPEDSKPLILLPIGYPDEKPDTIRRLSLNNLVFYEEYGKKKR